MAIKDLQPRTGNANVTAAVTEKGPVREFQKFGRPGRVCSCKISDESGECTLSLWNEQVDMVNAGDKVKITNGWVNEWQGQNQLSTGKNGTLEVVGKADASASEPTQNAAPKPMPAKPKVDEAEEEFI